MHIIKKIYFLLDSQERNRITRLLVLTLCVSIFDALGVASIMPFIGVLANPSLLTNSNVFRELNVQFGPLDNYKLYLYLGCCVFLLLMLSLIFRAIVTYRHTKFTLNLEYRLSKRLVAGYLGQPYVWFLNRNSAELGKTILAEVSQVIYNVMQPAMIVFTQGATVVAILGLLIIVDVKLAIVVGGCFSVSYLLVIFLTKKYLTKSGEERLRADNERFFIINQTFGGIKEIKINGLENVFLEKFSNPAERYEKSQKIAQLASQTPRYLLEAVAFGSVNVLIIYLISSQGDLTAALPMIALYALSGYRLLPSFNQIYGSLSHIRFSRPSLDYVVSELECAASEKKTSNNNIFFAKKIELSNVKYKYPKSNRYVLNDINLHIPKGSVIGLVGKTGSGKSTAVDIILGLIEPKYGAVTIDNMPLNEGNKAEWQKMIGYVPQNIYLSDQSIACNIAFGEDEDKFDYEMIEKAAKIANIHHFIVDELPNKYATVVGERGARLSGGQRQRIGIARALYKNPKLLVLDESTSALDNVTEFEVMNSIEELTPMTTVIIIAHRLSTLRNCSNIYEFQNGKIVASGKFSDLIKNSDTFKSMTTNI